MHLPVAVVDESESFFFPETLANISSHLNAFGWFMYASLNETL